jgi:hypothetical protein
MRIVKGQILRLSLAAMFFFHLTVLAQARPPSSIDLTYDAAKESLHIDIKHVSENMRKHYIRKITVTKNKEVPSTYFYSSQTSASEMIVDVPMKAMPKDTITVEVVCSEAGRGEQTLVIPEG